MYQEKVQTHFVLINQRKNCDYNLAEGLAATILLGSFGSTGSNKGTSVQELKLASIKPNSFNHNNIHTALDLLEESAHYLYYSTSGQRRYWFHTKPNVNILINQARAMYQILILKQT